MPNIVGMENLANLGLQIAAARKNAALRQVDLAHRARVSRATVDALENGRVSDIGFVRLMRIFESLGIGLRMESLGDTPKMMPKPEEKTTQAATKNAKAMQCRI